MKIAITGIIFAVMVMIAFAILSYTDPSMITQLFSVMDFFQNSQNTDNMTKTQTIAKTDVTQTRPHHGFATCDQLRKDLKSLNIEQAKLANLNDHHGLQTTIKEKNELVRIIEKYCK